MSFTVGQKVTITAGKYAGRTGEVKTPHYFNPEEGVFSPSVIVRLDADAAKGLEAVSGAVVGDTELVAAG